MSKFEIAFDVPSHGWLPVRFCIGRKQIAFEASDVLNDPVAEIVIACVQLLSGSSKLTAHWWHEPAWYVLKFDKRPDGSELEVTLSHLRDENDNNPKLECRATVSTLEVCRSVATALEGLFQSIGQAEYASDSGWGKPFPIDNMALLRQLIAEVDIR